MTGYYLSAATMIADELNAAGPELVRRTTLVSCDHDPVRSMVGAMVRMFSSGVAPGDVVADSGYSHRVPSSFALPLRLAGASLVMDLHPSEQGTQGTHEGAISWKRSALLPRHARGAVRPLAPCTWGERRGDGRPRPEDGRAQPQGVGEGDRGVGSQARGGHLQPLPAGVGHSAGVSPPTVAPYPTSTAKRDSAARASVRLRAATVLVAWRRLPDTGSRPASTRKNQRPLPRSTTLPGINPPRICDQPVIKRIPVRRLAPPPTGIIQVQSWWQRGDFADSDSEAVFRSGSLSICPRHGRGTYTIRTPHGTLVVVSIPVTTRLDQDLVVALDTAVGAGLAPNRSSLVAAAVREWLASHGEEAIVDSYRRRYVRPDPPHEELIQRLATYSVAECLANES